jgi:hypothetical protein
LDDVPLNDDVGSADESPKPAHHYRDAYRPFSYTSNASVQKARPNQVCPASTLEDENEAQIMAENDSETEGHPEPRYETLPSSNEEEARNNSLVQPMKSVPEPPAVVDFSALPELEPKNGKGRKKKFPAWKIVLLVGMGLLVAAGLAVGMYFAVHYILTVSPPSSTTVSGVTSHVTTNATGSTTAVTTSSNHASIQFNDRKQY